MEWLETLFDAECWFAQTCSTLVPAFFPNSLFSTDDAWLRRVLLLRSWWNVFQAVLSNSTSLIQSLVVIFWFVVGWRRLLWHFVNWRVNEILDYLHSEPALLLLPSKFLVQHIGVAHCNIQEMENNFPVPLQCFSERIIVRSKLVWPVHSAHVLVVIQNTIGLLTCSCLRFNRSVWTIRPGCIVLNMSTSLLSFHFRTTICPDLLLATCPFFNLDFTTFWGRNSCCVVKCRTSAFDAPRDFWQGEFQCKNYQRTNGSLCSAVGKWDHWQLLLNDQHQMSCLSCHNKQRRSKHNHWGHTVHTVLYRTCAFCLECTVWTWDDHAKEPLIRQLKSLCRVYKHLEFDDGGCHKPVSIWKVCHQPVHLQNLRSAKILAAMKNDLVASCVEKMVLPSENSQTSSYLLWVFEQHPSKNQSDQFSNFFYISFSPCSGSTVRFWRCAWQGTGKHTG